MSRKNDESVVVGAPPAADLLPKAVKDAIRRRPIVRRLVIVVMGVVLFTILAVVGATFLSISAQGALQAEQERSETLLAQQLQFSEARSVSIAVDESIAARLAATGTEADWNALLDEIRATLPEGLVLVSVDGAIRTAGEEEQPLRQDSVGSFRIDANSQTVPNVESWLEALEGVTGFAGIAPPVTVSGSETGTYSVSIEFLVNSDVFLERFGPVETEPEEDADAEEEPATEETEG